MFTRKIEDYVSLPYTIEVVRDQGENYSGWFARVVELPGCMTQADNFEELGEMITDAIRAWIETALEEGQTIPEPRPIEDYSGKFVVRVPRVLHRELVEAAEREGVSLNAFVSVAMGKAIGGKISDAENAAVQEPLPITNWSKLSEKARRVLIANGCSLEAQEIDEKYFSDWLENNLQQIQAATTSGMYKEAVDYVKSIHQSLEIMCKESPLITTYCQAIALLEEQIVQNCDLREGIIQLTTVRQRIQAEVRDGAQKVIYETKQTPKFLDYQDQLEKIDEWSKIFSENKNRSTK
jgi:antitoxin HicB